jgi:poly(A) polymerase
MSEPGAIEEMTPAPEAYVPIIKLEYSGISVDLNFVSIATASSIDENFDLISTNAVLMGLSDQDVKAINGPRVNDQLLSLVPEKKTFRQALRAVKLWAQRRAIYANIFGFPGGIAWALMVARVCQLYPHATGSTLVWKFFTIMAGWKWPNPIILKDIEESTGQQRVWNPSVSPSSCSSPFFFRIGWKYHD